MSQAQQIRVLLVDDHRRVHQVISEMIGFIDDIVLVAQANNGAEAVELCQQYNPDLVLMDVVMPVMDGIEATQRIIKNQPHMKILALSSFREQDTTHAMLKHGAIGYVLKDASVADLENTIRTAYEGKGILSPEVMRSLLEKDQAPPPTVQTNLTPRETEVLKLCADGLNNGEIAAALTISRSTVKFHIRNVIEKLGVETRAEALVVAAKNKLV